MTDTGTFYTNYTFEYPNENVRIATSSFQDVPSNQKRLINLTMNGILRPSEKLHEIKMKFEGYAPQAEKGAQSYGTFVLCKDVYNAVKVIKTLWDKETDTFTIIIDLRSFHVRPKRPTQFSFSIQINDCGGTCKFTVSETKNGATFYTIITPCPNACLCSPIPSSVGKFIRSCVEPQP